MKLMHISQGYLRPQHAQEAARRFIASVQNTHIRIGIVEDKPVPWGMETRK